MRKEDVKEFLKRGFAFGGLGCIIVGFIYWMISLGIKDLNLQGWQIFVAILSGYVIAFIHAGTSVFHQIDSWSPLKSATFQLVFLYITHLVIYLVNSWIPLRLDVILIFTGLFIVGYLIIWLIILLIVRKSVKRINKQL